MITITRLQFHAIRSLAVANRFRHCLRFDSKAKPTRKTARNILRQVQQEKRDGERGRGRGKGQSRYRHHESEGKTTTVYNYPESSS